MRLLIVGTLDGHIASAGKIALERGAKVAHADSVDAALNALRGGQGADLIMIDVQLDVAKLCTSLESERISVPVVGCGIGAEAKLAVNAIKAGAKEYIPLPPDAELIAAVLAAVAEETSSLIHRDPAMARVLRLTDQIAPSDASVLITGESGTGKEVLAHYLHSKSKRARRHFISLNCAAIPETLLESELFGHEKGAFTGAVGRRIGKFEEANGGTLLLDEISEMHPRLQAKLLRAIQEREIDRVGGSQPIKVDIRLIATSNRDLEEEVRQGNFREDLYFRLNVVTLNLPALRERPRDIEVLAEHFAAKYAEANGVPTPTISPEVRELLLNHPWRGNVRELENTMHRAVLLGQGTVITPESVLLDHGFRASGGAAEDTASEGVAEAAGAVEPETDAENGVRALVGRTVADVERDLILDTLQHCLGNRTHAANILGISIRTLRNKLKLYSQDGITIPTPGEAERSSA
ncbi:MAG: sigma-54-dependent Fis family transcriptional regulator [Gemmatimonadetes bacterium]|uniref:Sigma-54-dependent Fis family transcriptional regulator n=1 Tax=Candidatus Kutchimonas denitrificans TaxID=3056748 RepID=A0AAE4ZB11_9BACT|nr:sigma-54-dependent Fis family transcriptional regulator [Candidatus Kutchimonas denitrificans]